jgi:hypothetical protein
MPFSDIWDNTDDGARAILPSGKILNFSTTYALSFSFLEDDPSCGPGLYLFTHVMLALSRADPLVTTFTLFVDLWTSSETTTEPLQILKGTVVPSLAVPAQPGYVVASFINPIAFDSSSYGTSSFALSLSSQDRVLWNDVAAPDLPSVSLGAVNGSWLLAESGDVWSVSPRYPGIRLRGYKAACGVTPTQSQTQTISQTQSRSATQSQTNSQTQTRSQSQSQLATKTQTISQTQSKTLSQIPTPTQSASQGRTSSQTGSQGATTSQTGSQVATASQSWTTGLSPSSTPSQTQSQSMTPSQAVTPTQSMSLTPSQSVSIGYSLTSTQSFSQSQSASPPPPPSSSQSQSVSSSQSTSASQSQTHSGFPSQPVIDNTVRGSVNISAGVFQEISPTVSRGITFFWPESDPVCGPAPYALASVTVALSQVAQVNHPCALLSAL